MADPASTKPFSPEETQRILRHLQTPTVFTNMAAGWPALLWTAERLSHCLGDNVLRFRLGRKEETNTPLFETQCSYVEARLEDFLSWTRDRAGPPNVGPFCEYPNSEYWAYADYKYIAMLFEDRPSMFEDVKWSDFGFEGRDGRASTLWVGTRGANTPCHLDSYGFNLVLQVQGRKRWHLFPPEDTANLYPTRIPYEESSVFSRVHVVHPDLRRFPAFRGSRAHVVTLQPGQVLYVPTHWWHYVESLDPVTVSVNSWIEQEEDDVERVGEAVTKTVVCAFKRDDADDWLNPTEDGVASHQDNMRSVNLALRACVQRPNEPARDRRDAGPVKRDSGGQIKDRIKASVAFRVPFGPHLIPVSPETTKHLEVKSQEDEEERGGGLPRCRPAGPADETHEELLLATITTNDLLDCLLHPDVISRVTELLLERHTGSRSSTDHV